MLLKNILYIIVHNLTGVQFFSKKNRPPPPLGVGPILITSALKKIVAGKFPTTGGRGGDISVDIYSLLRISLLREGRGGFCEVWPFSLGLEFFFFEPIPKPELSLLYFLSKLFQIKRK